MKSFKQMIKDGDIKRADAMKIQLSDIHAEPGFNLRAEGPELDASIDELAQFILDGGQVPPLEVRPRTDGGVWIVDGHRRHRAYIKAAERGAPVEFVAITAFTGNDADRVARIMTSQEGVKLLPLEIAAGYRRLAAFGLTPAEIAKKVNKTRQHVDQMLILDAAPQAVKQMVKAGEVSATTAMQVVRANGDDAGAILAGKVDQAKANGKAKATAGAVQGKPLPAKVVEPVLDSLDGFMETLSLRTRTELARHEKDAIADTTVSVSAAALLHLVYAHEQLLAARAKRDDKQRQAEEKSRQGELAA
jgi:ParB/RepB/Spo0J family partition protein